MAWFIYFAGRHAESHTELDGVHDEIAPPVWVVGQAGLLRQFQDAPGTGVGSIQYHCKVSKLTLLLGRPQQLCFPWLIAFAVQEPVCSAGTKQALTSPHIASF